MEKLKTVINGFTTLINQDSDIDTVRVSLTSLYMNYSRMAIQIAEANDTGSIPCNIQNELFYLNQVIDVLEGNYHSDNNK